MLTQRWLSMSDEENKEQIMHEEDEQGSIIAYPVWTKKNAPKDQQNKWEVPIYL
jgi:hypothetical protein